MLLDPRHLISEKLDVEIECACCKKTSLIAHYVLDRDKNDLPVCVACGKAWIDSLRRWLNEVDK